MRRVLRRRGGIRFPASRRLRGGFALCAIALALLGAPAVAGAEGQTAVSAQVGASPFGPVMAPGFVGVSLEYKAMHIYTGRDPTHINPVLVALLRNLAPGQPPSIRIGGNSTDKTWWPIRRMIPPAGINYGLTKGWMRTTQALAAALGAKLILGINLAGRRPAIAAAEARALLEGIGSRYIQALEIGNEPDLYGMFAWYRDRRGRVVFSRPPTYSFADFTSEFARWRAVMPTAPLAGPAVSSVNWMAGLDGFLSSEPALRMVTLHRYPLRACTTNPSDPLYASPTNLLADPASSGLAQQVAPYVTIAHEHDASFRLDELNSAACTGRFGVSNTMASALWALDALFNLAAVGVDGVNIHTLPMAPYEPFTFTQSRSGWSAFVHPIYYGLQMFAQAFPPGAQLLPVSAPAGAVKVWATRSPDGHLRIVLINKQQTTPVTVQLQLPGGQSTASVESLLAPSARATSGVTLGGQTFGLKTTTGVLGTLQTSTVIAGGDGTFSISMPAASAMLLTQ
jgi:Glycosyl hydrolase family 79 C-terminal beta domain